MNVLLEHNIRFLINTYFLKEDICKDEAVRNANHIHMMGGYTDEELNQVIVYINNNFEDIKTIKQKVLDEQK